MGNHSSSTAARICWAGICCDRISGVGTAVAAAAAAASEAAGAVAVERVDGRSIGSRNSARGDIDHNH